MATTKIWAVHSRLDKLVDYVSNQEKTKNLDFETMKTVIEYAGEDLKTEQKCFVSGVNCIPETAYDEMKKAHEKNKKEIIVLAYHAFQSFAEGEVTAETAHEVGIKMANELWGDKFQIIVATHLNTNHYHNHFVLCATSYKDGSRYNDCGASYRRMREVSDRLCREYALSVIENPQKGRTKHYAQWRAEKEGTPTWKSIVKADVDRAIAQAYLPDDFISILKQNGYEIKIGKDISVKPPGKERSVRLMRNFGDEYSKENIRLRIVAPKPRRKLMDESKSYNHGNFKKVKKLKGIEAKYFHYRYLMGIIPEKNAPRFRVHFLMKDELIKLDKHDKEIRLLSLNKIETDVQLLEYKTSLVQKVDTLTLERKDLHKNPKTPDMEIQITALSEKIRKLRAEIKLCDGIPARVTKLVDMLLQQSQGENIKGKEENQNELFRRSGRPNR